MFTPVPLVPSPKAQLQETIDPSGSVEAAPLKVTGTPAVALGGAKAATGDWSGATTRFWTLAVPTGVGVPAFSVPRLTGTTASPPAAQSVLPSGLSAISSISTPTRTGDPTIVLVAVSATLKVSPDFAFAM